MNAEELCAKFTNSLLSVINLASLASSLLIEAKILINLKIDKPRKYVKTNYL